MPPPAAAAASTAAAGGEEAGEADRIVAPAAPRCTSSRRVIRMVIRAPLSVRFDDERRVGRPRDRDLAPERRDDAARLGVLVEHGQLADRRRDDDLGRDADVRRLLDLAGEPVRSLAAEGDLLRVGRRSRSRPVAPFVRARTIGAVVEPDERRRSTTARRAGSTCRGSRRRTPSAAARRARSGCRAARSCPGSSPRSCPPSSSPPPGRA